MRIQKLLLLGFPAALAAQSTPLPVAPAPFGAPFKARSAAGGAVKVGPPHGTVIVVGGGGMGPEVYKAFIDAAGGPDALIVDVPNAGGGDTVPTNTGNAWRTNGAKNVVVYFTKDRKVADSDSMVAILKKSGRHLVRGRPAVPPRARLWLYQE